MKLEGCYIKDAGVIKNQFLNFGSRYVYSLKKDELIIKKNDNYIEDFFGNSIENITAIVGKNASGKSTVIKFLMWNFIEMSRLSGKTNLDNQKFVFIVYDEKVKKSYCIFGGFEVFLNSKTLQVELLEINKDYKKINNIIDKLDISYISPIVDMDQNYPQNNSENKNFKNLSLKLRIQEEGYQVRNTIDNYFLSNTVEDERFGYRNLDRVWNKYVFEVLETFNKEDFSNEFNVNDIDIKFPKKIIMQPLHVYYNLNTNSSLFDMNENNIMRIDKIDTENCIEEEKVIYGLIKKLLESNEFNNGIVAEYLLIIIDTFFGDLNRNFGKQFMDYIIGEYSSIKGSINFKEENLLENDTNEIVEKIIKYMELVGRILDKGKDEVTENNIKTYSLVGVKTRSNLKSGKKYFELYQHTIAEIFKLINEMLDKNILEKDGIEKIDINSKTNDLKGKSYSIGDRTAYLNLEKAEAIIYAKKFIELFDMLPVKKVLNIVRFENICSGETAKLMLFSDIIRSIDLGKEGSTQIYIDEGETYFHPEWKRTYLYEIIEFINSYLKDKKDKKVQLIIATNSPYCISDLPNNNIIALDNGIIKDVDVNFAGNIHNLLKNSMFMKNTIGEFSKRKIQEIIKFMMEYENTNNQIGKFDLYEKKKEIEYIIEIIGEPVIKRKLEELYRAKFPKEDIDYKAKIKKLEEDKQNLEKILENKGIDTMESVVNLLKMEIEKLKAEDKN